MKSPPSWLVKLYQPEAESVKWRVLLRFLGVESTLLHKEVELARLLLHDSIGLIFIDRALLGQTLVADASSCLHWLERGGGIALTGQDGPAPISAPFLARMTDVSERDPFTINALLRRFVPTYSRHYPRLETRLPGLYARSAGISQICEIMDLSPGGAFIRTTESLPAQGEDVQVNVPLIGLHKEIEIKSRVVSQILPNERNNYAQGIGVSFILEDNSPVLMDLNDYVRYVLAHDEALDPQFTPFSGCRPRRNPFTVTSLISSQVKGREPSLTPIH